MIKQYIRQAFTLMRQNRLFTGIYVLGTGLSIAFTMILFIILYIKFAPVYPEYNRDRMLVVGPVTVVGKQGVGYTTNIGVSPKCADLFRNLPHLDKVSLCCPLHNGFNNKVLLPELDREIPASINFVDADYWKVFTFDFISGRPFTEAAVESNLSEAVITEDMAMRIFATTDVVGKNIILDGGKVKVKGVVKRVTAATPNTAADIFLPISFNGINKTDENQKGLVGNFVCYLLAKNEGDKDALRNEVIEAVKKYNDADKDYTSNLMGQPDEYWKSSLRGVGEEEKDVMNTIRTIIYVLFALLIIPAMNLCGMNASRMEERMSEIGVRKAYGASNRSLMMQILTENFLLTLIGGIIGLVFAYVVAFSSGNLIIHLFDSFVMPNSVSTDITMEMLLNPTLFVIVLLICLVLNVLSAVIPAMAALRHPIINAIQTKR